MAQVEQMKEYCRLHEKIKMLVDQAKNLIQVSFCCGSIDNGNTIRRIDEIKY